MGALDYRDRICVLAGQKPVLPTEVAKELGTNSMLASAMLSEMSEKGLLKVSHLKVGSSPLYYHPGHPEHLLGYVQHLNEKDRKTVSLLQEKGVLRDADLDPLTRVSLRNIKDFASPLDVTINGVKELFWKFYLLSDEQASEAIKRQLVPEEAKTESLPVQKQRKSMAKRRAQPAALVVQETLVQTPQQSHSTLGSGQPSGQAGVDDPFLQQLLAFFSANNIKVVERVVLKRKAEYDFVLQVPSPVGSLQYYCKAKNKARVGEADLSQAYVQGQLKKLPVLFLASGSLTRPAQELLKELKGLTVKQVS